MESSYFSPSSHSTSESIEAYDKLVNLSLDHNTTKHSRRNQSDQTKDNRKFEISALPSPDTTPRVLRLPTPEMGSSLLSPPMDMTRFPHSPSSIRSLSRPRADSQISLASDAQPLFSSSPKSFSEDFATEKPRLPSFAEFVAATDLNRVQDDRMQQKQRPLATGLWFRPDFRPEAVQFPQVIQYMEERPAEYRRLNDAANRRHRVLASEARQELSKPKEKTDTDLWPFEDGIAHIRLAPLTKKALPTAPRPSRVPTKKRASLPGTAEKSVRQVKKSRKADTNSDFMTPPAKKKRAAPTENKEKFEFWREIGQWYGIIPEITPDIEAVAKTNHRTVFGYWYNGSTTAPAPKSRLSRNDRNLHLLADFEIELAERLGWDSEKFLIHKLRLFRANFEELSKKDAKPFNKTRAQQSGQCDVNNMSRFFECYSGVGMINHQFIHEAITDRWNEAAAKRHVADKGIERIQNKSTAKAELAYLRTSHRGGDLTLSPSSDSESTQVSPMSSALKSSGTTVHGEFGDELSSKRSEADTPPQDMNQVDLAAPMYKDGLSKDRLF